MGRAPETDPARRARAAAGRLRDAPALLELPADKVRPTVLGSAVDSVAVPTTSSLSDRLHQFAECNGTDLYTILLAAWTVLLLRTTDQSDLVVGCGGHGTCSRPEGMLVLRQQVEGSSSFADVVRTTGEALARAGEDADVSLAELLTAMAVEPGPAKHPIFQVAFSRLPSVDSPPWPATSSWPAPPDAAFAWVWQPDSGLRCRIDYSPELFDRGRLQRLAEQLVTLLEAGLDQPSCEVADLELLPAEEIERLRKWNATERDHDDSVPIAALFLQQVERTPDRIALEHQGSALSYAELGHRVDCLARLLQDEGVGPDVTVVVCAERSIEMVVAVLAVLVAGGAYVPVDPAYPATRRSLMVQDSEAAVILTQRPLLAGLPQELSSKVVLLEDAAAPGDSPGEPPLQPANTGEHLGYVIYTSGSTGQPKGVAMPQSALTNLLAWQLRRPHAVAEARTLQFTSLSFDVSFQEIFATLCSGGTLVLVADATRRDPMTLLDFLIEQRITRLFLPYVALRGLAAAVASTGRVPTHLRELYTAGEQLQSDPALRALLRALRECTLENQYGPAESHVVTAHTLEADSAEWPALPPIGRPIDNSEVHVLDARGRARPIGIPGELYLAGACLAHGYLGQPERTAERFLELDLPTGPARRVYRTGDLGRWLPDGSLEFLGRADHQVKFRGYRIEPGEIGTVLSGAPGISQCVAVVRPGESGARLTAYLLGKDVQPDVGAVHAFARENLPAHMVPSHYLVLNELPLTSSGKVDTRALPEASFDRNVLSQRYRAPTTADEVALVAIWQRLLAVPEVGVDDDFFELGGDSLAGAEMVEIIAQQLGVEIPLGALAEGPTIAALARTLRRPAGSVWHSLVPLQTGGERPPLFVVHGGSGNVATFPRLARALPADQPVYALQWDGLDGSRGQRTVEKMAQHYLNEVRAVQAGGPYLLAGQCIGGLVAREMTRRLLAVGEQVDLLVMYDSPHLASPAYEPGRRPSPLDLVTVANGRRARLRIKGRLALGRRVMAEDIIKHGEMAMVHAAWKHRANSLPEAVPTLYMTSGESDGSRLALSGRWTDGAMGWAAADLPGMTIHRIHGEHNEIMYHPKAVALLTEALERCHRHLATSPSRSGTATS